MKSIKLYLILILIDIEKIINKIKILLYILNCLFMIIIILLSIYTRFNKNIFKVLLFVYRYIDNSIKKYLYKVF